MVLDTTGCNRKSIVFRGNSPCWEILTCTGLWLKPHMFLMREVKWEEEHRSSFRSWVLIKLTPACIRGCKWSRIWQPIKAVLNYNKILCHSWLHIKYWHSAGGWGRGGSPLPATNHSSLFCSHTHHEHPTAQSLETRKDKWVIWDVFIWNSNTWWNT